MSESVYRVTEVIGVSPDSWEAAARNAVETARGRSATCASPKRLALT
jgi:flavin-binding protein dodecin